MIILGIETSCDETAISIIEANGTYPDISVKILANNVLSQIELHKQYGGVFPMMAKREHQKNLVPLMIKTLKEQDSLISNSKFLISNKENKLEKIKEILEKEPELLKQFEKEIPQMKKPQIDYIAVTKGPGLEPALWVGINFALALSEYWQIPIIPVNHMEGHILISLLKQRNEKFLISPALPDLAKPENFKFLKKEATDYTLSTINFPVLVLLVSGGHTQLVLIKEIGSTSSIKSSGEPKYEIIGETRDDAVGEAFDKVARILGLPYPGGPEISKLAEQARKECETNAKLCEKIPPFPRPMIHSKDYDFSFSGLKTHVLYLVQKLLKETDNVDSNNFNSAYVPHSSALSPRLQSLIAREFEDAVIDVLLSKTSLAMKEFGAETLILGGGVTANKELRRRFSEFADLHRTPLCIPEIGHSTDNALMISIASIFHTDRAKIGEKIKANGNWGIDQSL